MLTPLLLTACGGISAGVVTAKHYDPESTVTTFQCMPMGNNPCGMLMPYIDTTPECWRLDLRDGGKTGDTCVSKADWDRVQIGQHWGYR